MLSREKFQKLGGEKTVWNSEHPEAIHGKVIWLTHCASCTDHPCRSMVRFRSGFQFTCLSNW
jgi:hypothetical protein